MALSVIAVLVVTVAVVVAWGGAAIALRQSQALTMEQADVPAAGRSRRPDRRQLADRFGSHAHVVIALRTGGPANVRARRASGGTRDRQLTIGTVSRGTRGGLPIGQSLR